MGFAEMPKVAFKAHCLDRATVELAVRAAGAHPVLSQPPAAGEPLPAYRETPREASLIGQFRTVGVAPHDEEPEPAWPAADDGDLPRPARFAGPGWTVSVNRLNGFDFVAVEVPFAAGADASPAAETAEQLRRLLGVGHLDVIPWSYGQLRNIVRSAEQWRRRLGDLDRRLFLIDGPSGAGKSTVARALRDEAAPGYRYVPRRSTRPPRPDDLTADEYVHIDIDSFRQAAIRGEFLEYREFKFTMGYGLAWSDVASALDRPGIRAGYALVNLGNSRHIQRFVPDATTILVTAPLDQLEGRMKARGERAHAPDAIAERLENARRGEEAAAISDHVIENRNGRFDDSLRAVRKIIYGT